MERDGASAERDDALSLSCLTRDIVANILQHFEPRKIGALQAVSRSWRDVARDPGVLQAAFVRHWAIGGVTGTPRQPSFLHTATLAAFVKRHEVERGDTLQALAVRHGVHPVAIKRVNNLMSDHSLHSRHYLFIPVADKAELRGAVVEITFDALAKRDVALLPCTARGGDGGGDGAACARALRLQVQGLRAKMSQMLGRSLCIDEETAHYYLDEAHGDLKAAISAYHRDHAWDAASGGIVRVSRMQRWIEGRVGV